MTHPLCNINALFCWPWKSWSLEPCCLNMITVLIFDVSFITWASLVAQMVKNLPAMWETWVWSLSWEDLLEEGMAIHSSILAWRIPMDRGAWWGTVHGVTKSWTWLSNLYCCYCVHHLEMWLLHGLYMDWTTVGNRDISLSRCLQRNAEYYFPKVSKCRPFQRQRWTR